MERILVAFSFDGYKLRSLLLPLTADECWGLVCISPTPGTRKKRERENECKNIKGDKKENEEETNRRWKWGLVENEKMKKDRDRDNDLHKHGVRKTREKIKTHKQKMK